MARTGDLIHNYAGTALWGVGPELRAFMEVLAKKAQAEYQATVAKDTGELAASASSWVGIHKGQSGFSAWTGYVQGNVRHAAPHEFGWHSKDGTYHEGAHELEEILARSLG